MEILDKFDRLFGTLSLIILFKKSILLPVNVCVKLLGKTVANSIEPDQAFDLGLHYSVMPAYPNT